MRTHPVQSRGSRNACQLHVAGEGGSERREGNKITLIFTKSIQVHHGASYRDETFGRRVVWVGRGRSEASVGHVEF